ncbi:MAG: glutamate--cysteine ligase [Pseudomonadota bacterium]
MLEQRLGALQAAGDPDVLCGGHRGVEKESLRVAPDGKLSQRAHPRALGSALTNEFITTDFSEALLEFVTPAFATTWEALGCLCDIHQFVYANLDDELLWVSSMPCLIGDDKDIPLARYGRSNVGRMKTIYRRGLGYRYGRAMQTIAGLHFNYSLPESFWPVYRQARGAVDELPDFQSAEYLGLIRNFRRFGWLVLYLFGASPAVCKSFVGDARHNLSEFDAETFFEPYATSLRMSDLGYTNKTQASINISLNSLDEYVAGLSAAIDTPEPEYADIGVVVDGRYRQLSANRLQIENEYYSPVRPKRVARSGERPTSALQRGGIQYVEIRSLDLGLADPVGINQNVMRFMESFMVYCLLAESPPMDAAEYAEVLDNHTQVAHRGRDPDLKLRRNAGSLTLRDWAAEIVAGVIGIAEMMDANSERDDYAAAARAQAALVRDADATPSARILQDLRDERIGFFRYALNRAREHKAYFEALQPLAADKQAAFEAEARSSLARQAEIEAADTIDFETYLSGYYDS